MPEQHIDNEKIPTRLIGAIVAVGSLAFIGISTVRTDVGASAITRPDASRSISKQEGISSSTSR